MAIGVEVPKNLSGIKTKVALNLTRRQLICFGTAALVGVPLYLGVKNTVGTDIAAILMMAVMVPLFLLAMYEKDGMPAEKILMLMIRQRYILPGIRRYGRPVHCGAPGLGRLRRRPRTGRQSVFPPSPA